MSPKDVHAEHAFESHSGDFLTSVPSRISFVTDARRYWE
jgi:hypothetical protein